MEIHLNCVPAQPSVWAVLRGSAALGLLLWMRSSDERWRALVLPAEATRLDWVRLDSIDQIKINSFGIDYGNAKLGSKVGGGLTFITWASISESLRSLRRATTFRQSRAAAFGSQVWIEEFFYHSSHSLSTLHLSLFFFSWSCWHPLQVLRDG